MTARTNNFAISRASVGRVTSMFYYLIPLNSSRLCHPPPGASNPRANQRRVEIRPCIFIFFRKLKRERESDPILSHATSLLYLFSFKDYLKQFSQPSCIVLSVPYDERTTRQRCGIGEILVEGGGKINTTTQNGKIILFIINV